MRLSIKSHNFIRSLQTLFNFEKRPDLYAVPSVFLTAVIIQFSSLVHQPQHDWDAVQLLATPKSDLHVFINILLYFTITSRVHARPQFPLIWFVHIYQLLPMHRGKHLFTGYSYAQLIPSLKTGWDRMRRAGLLKHRTLFLLLHWSPSQTPLDSVVLLKEQRIVRA